jgi:hypothetical protein
METDEKREPYSPPDILELGSASELTMGQAGPDVDADAQHAPSGPTPARALF